MNKRANAIKIILTSAPTDILTLKAIKTPVNSCKELFYSLLMGIKLMMKLLMTLKVMTINLGPIYKQKKKHNLNVAQLI